MNKDSSSWTRLRKHKQKWLSLDREQIRLKTSSMTNGKPSIEETRMKNSTDKLKKERPNTMLWLQKWR